MSLILLSLVLFIGACVSDSSKGILTKKKGEEGPLLERYMKELAVSEANQSQVDQNLIINLLIDSLWDFQKTPSGIYYQFDEIGEGPSPNLNSKITCNYRGTLLNGKEFDSSYKRGKPLEFKLREVIAGWQETIPLLQKGGSGTFIIPSRLAYGKQKMGHVIKPNSVLIFEIELLDFE